MMIQEIEELSVLGFQADEITLYNAINCFLATLILLNIF